ncbi:pancreatic triacylglycerol lipase-like [Sipha flava]|uniref:Pancreatic triacylglycerol lipase-like n=1 Tax=Sipha flava TaxID=143950 RepID=A0A8B8FP06_9HEMI|nr:pancreatic triacylglycerol lipase-like [Sipha flava]
MIRIYLWFLYCIAPIKGDFLSVLPGFKKFKDCIEPSEDTCPNKNITFHLYTRNTTDYELTEDQDNLLNAPFILNASIKLLIHGYTGDQNYSPNTELRPAYLKYQNLNVISVDYKSLVRPPCYVQGVHNVPLVGKCTASILSTLFNVRKDIKKEQLHVIGFSLGAQVASHVGRLMNSTLKRITGLDPASPLFNPGFVGNDVLDKSDALFVDVLHTNAGMKGKYLPLGHVDFYANNGALQPGCGKNTSCCHVRAVEYFTESIESQTKFLALKCFSYSLFKITSLCNVSKTSPLVEMGEHVNENDRGIYFFMTKSKPPYALGTDIYGTNSTE